jgi:hypothetical protein
MLLVPGLVAVSFAWGWVVMPVAALVAAGIFGQVTINDTTTGRYIAQALRARMYSVRFFVGFLGAAAAAPLVAWSFRIERKNCGRSCGREGNGARMR